MIKLLDTSDNAINSVTTTQMVTAISLINQSKKDAATATAAGRKKDKDAAEVKPTITTREEAKREAER